MTYCILLISTEASELYLAIHLMSLLKQRLNVAYQGRRSLQYSYQSSLNSMIRNMKLT